MSDSEYFIAEFKGTYRAPHPSGARDQQITKDFHVKVKMLQTALDAPGLKGAFQNYYKESVKALYPDLIDFYSVQFIKGVELNGDKIDNPKAMSYADLVAYITRKKYPVNPLLFDQEELRNQVVLYEFDPSGQQLLQGKTEKLRGGQIEMALKLAAVDDLVVVVDPTAVVEVVAAGKPPAKKG